LATRHKATSQLEGFAEDLGRLLGTAAAKADKWMAQRQAIVKQLTDVRDTASKLLAEHDHGGIAFGRPTGCRDRRVDDQSVAILGQQMREIPEFRFAADGLLVEPRVGIGRRLVRVVPPRLPTEIHGRILRIVGRAVRAALRFKSLCDSPRLPGEYRRP
jgi:hypothetical protein